jgi:hypothetical protein
LLNLRDCLHSRAILDVIRRWQWLSASRADYGERAPLLCAARPRGYARHGARDFTVSCVLRSLNQICFEETQNYSAPCEPAAPNRLFIAPSIAKRSLAVGKWVPNRPLSCEIRPSWIPDCILARYRLFCWGRSVSAGRKQARRDMKSSPARRIFQENPAAKRLSDGSTVSPSKNQDPAQRFPS